MTELFAVPKSNYKPLSCPEDAPEKYKSLSTYRMGATVLGREATTVIVYNPELEKGQLQGIQINIEKTKSELLEIQGKLLCSLTEAICLTTRLYLPTVARGTLKVHSSR